MTLPGEVQAARAGPLVWIPDADVTRPNACHGMEKSAAPVEGSGQQCLQTACCMGSASTASSKDATPGWQPLKPPLLPLRHAAEDTTAQMLSLAKQGVFDRNTNVNSTDMTVTAAPPS